MSLVSKKTRYVLHGLAYIAKIFQDVSRMGFTEAVSGPRGGYRLSRPADQIRLIDVVEALEGPILTGCCLLSVGDCARRATCGVGNVIHNAERVFHDFFQKETVESLASQMDFPAPEALRAARSRPKVP